MFHIKVTEKMKTHILCSVIFFSKIVPFMNVEKCGAARKATDALCMMGTTIHARTYTRPRTHASARKHTQKYVTQLYFIVQRNAPTS